MAFWLKRLAMICTMGANIIMFAVEFIPMPESTGWYVRAKMTGVVHMKLTKTTLETTRQKKPTKGPL